MVILKDVEKIERFYLSSCTDISHADRSTHQSFAVIPRPNGDSVTISKTPSAKTQFRKRSKTRNERGTPSASSSVSNTGEPLPESSRRVKQAFLKMYGSLMSFNSFVGDGQETKEHAYAIGQSMPALHNNEDDIQEDNVQENYSGNNINDIRSNMSKEEFLEKFQLLVSEIREKPELIVPAANPSYDPNANKPGTSSSFRNQSPGVKSGNTNSKESSEASEERGANKSKTSSGSQSHGSYTLRAADPPPDSDSSPGKTLMIIGIGLAVLLGIMKVITNANTSSSPAKMKRMFDH